MRLAIVAVAGALGLMGACTPDEMPGAADGRALFMENCAVCHGEDARGNGPLARTTAKAPKDLTLIALRSGDSFPRARIMSVIDGYARSAPVDPAMPEFGELLQGELVPFDSGDGILTPTPRKLVALLEYIESVQQTR